MGLNAQTLFPVKNKIEEKSMRKSVKTKLLVLLMAILSLFVFAGCSMGESLEDALATRNLSPRVTYYANGGLFEDNSTVKDLYYSTDSKALNIGVVIPTSGSVNIKRDGFELAGWYFVDKVVDEKTGVCELGDEVDFTQTLDEGEHWVVAAKWRALVGLKVVMVCDDGETVAVDKAKDGLTAGATSFKNGDVIGEISYDSKDTVTSAATPDLRLFTVKDKTHTFFSYYMDAECTQEVAWPIKRAEEQQTVYAKYIKGDWSFVKTADDVYKMFAALKGGANKSYWICNDINYTKSTPVESMTSFGGEIKGNGYTISGLTFSKTLTQGVNKFSIFGDIKETAKISDLNLTEISVSLKLRNGLHGQVYLGFGSLAVGASVSSVQLSFKTAGVEIDGPDDAFVDNINGTGTATYGTCLFGGYATDEEYIAATEGKGFTVTGSAEEFIIIK